MNKVKKKGIIIMGKVNYRFEIDLVCDDLWGELENLFGNDSGYGNITAENKTEALEIITIALSDFWQKQLLIKEDDDVKLVAGNTYEYTNSSFGVPTHCTVIEFNYIMVKYVQTYTDGDGLHTTIQNCDIDFFKTHMKPL
jgi:hypothetical protein